MLRAARHLFAEQAVGVLTYEVGVLLRPVSFLFFLRELSTDNHLFLHF
jgi:hypothetical protein